MLQQNEILEGFQSNSTPERMDQLYEVDDDDDGGSGGGDDHDDEDDGDDDVLMSSELKLLSSKNWTIRTVLPQRDSNPCFHRERRSLKH